MSEFCRDEQTTWILEEALDESRIQLPTERPAIVNLDFPVPVPESLDTVDSEANSTRA